MANTNIYTIDTVTTNPIPTSGLLDNTSSFPPTNGYKLTLTPKPGYDIRAAQFRGGGITMVSAIGHPDFELSYFGTTNSHTQWPSRFQWVMPGLGDADPTTASGQREFGGIYKIVVEDSTNPTNSPNWGIAQSGGNKVYMWIYFGKNEITPIGSLNNIDLLLDLDYHPDPLILSMTILPGPGPVVPSNINNFNI
tara:strand:+ start:55 stop:636 length:582 start_codon:yes stop_codon:yes gene_type:complete